MRNNFYYLILLAVFFVSCGKTELVKKVDVLVIGGTTGGVSAGIQSARLGNSTLIVEETPWLGGMLTAAGVSATDGNHDLNSGIWNEFRQHLRDTYGGAEALATGWVSHTQFEPYVGDSILKVMATAEKDLETIYGFHLVSIKKEGNKVVGAIFENEKKERLIVEAQITIDATDLGDALKLSGAEYRLGMDAKAETDEAIALENANDVVQDLTWVAVLKDYGEGADKTIERPAGYDPADFKGCCDQTVDGDIINCAMMLDYARLPNNKYVINWPTKGNDVYLNIVEMDREARKIALQKAKERTLCFVYYIQHELGFKHLGLADDEFDTEDLLAYMPYHREGRRLKGISTLTYNHVDKPYEQKDALYRTGISVGDYPVDHHHKCNPDVPDLSFLPISSFNIPLGTLIPEVVEGLIVADKAISVTNLINGSTRLQPCVLLTGQAAGVLASLSVNEGKNPREISIRKVQSTLLEAKAYIMPLFDVKPTDKDFLPIQKIAATGIIKTTGEPYRWANRTWFYPDSTISVNEFTEGLSTFGIQDVVQNDKSLLTVGKLNKIMSSISADFQPVSSRENAPVLRRELAVVLDKYLNPFEREINHDGSFK